ncbi:MAG: ribbon-helix-helix domain-containing protein [Alphaproteobacteria bacterium]|nr:ribbon-helix-helix domain-containing protein [Alphaproteobacteria bacterium]
MNQNSEEALFQKKSVTLHGHKTSVSLEKAFWCVLADLAKAQDLSLSQLIKDVDEKRQGSLSSALRLYALACVLKQLTQQDL